MIQGESAYQTMREQQRYSTNRVKNSIFESNKREVDLCEENMFETEYEFFPDVAQFEIS